MSWMLVGGAALGAGVGSYGHDRWGWSKDAIWQGAAIGGAGGYAIGPAGAGAGAGTAGAGGAAGGAGSMYGYAGAGGSTAGAGAAGAGIGLMKPLVPGLGFTSPLFLGAAGLSLASGMTSKGSSFQQEIPLSEEGKKLQADYMKAAKGKMAKAKKGDVRDIAFGDISKLKTAEMIRQRQTKGAINTIQAEISNMPKEKRGGAAVGGKFIKAQLADIGERMTGLFAPRSALNSFRKEELLNATRSIMNMSNIDNQTAMFSYGSQLAKWQANQMLSSEKGAAIGSVIAGAGSMQLNQAYLNNLKMAS